MKWFKLATRQYSIQNDQLFRSGWYSDNPYYPLRDYLAIPIGNGMGDMYFIDREWDKLMKVLAREFLKDHNFLNRHLKRYKLLKKKVLKKALAIYKNDLTKYSSKKLYLAHQELFEEGHKYCIFAYFPWAMQAEIDPPFKTLLRKKFKKEWESIYNTVATPTKYNEITIQLIKLLKMKIDGNLKTGLKNHIKQYQWLPVYDFITPPWTKRIFLNQLKDIKDPKEELLRLERQLRNNRWQFQLAIKTLKSDKRLLNMAKLINEYIWLRTDRIDVIRKALFYGQPFYRELERKLGFKNQESVWMDSKEIKDFLLKGKINREEIRKRAKNGCMFYIRNGKTQLIYEPDKMKKVIEKELGVPKEKPKIIRGIVACKGLARGKVKVINSAEDISKMKKGNILVASMTLQEYMAAIRKAKAIITDEGGVTCHAAIISRELGIPCIIGTKIATKVLKDGNLVEMDANMGIVKILKK